SETHTRDPDQEEEAAPTHNHNKTTRRARLEKFSAKKRAWNQRRRLARVSAWRHPRSGTGSRRATDAEASLAWANRHTRRRAARAYVLWGVGARRVGLQRAPYGPLRWFGADRSDKRDQRKLRQCRDERRREQRRRWLRRDRQRRCIGLSQSA